MTASTEPALPEFTVKGHNGQPQPLRLIAHDVSAERDIILLLSEDAIHAYARVVRGENFARLTREDVVAVAARAGVVFGLQSDGVRLLVATVNADKPHQNYFEIATGLPPQRGEDGSIEFHVQPTSMNPRYDETDEGNIDFKQLNLIENCFAGQRVASILPPGPGRSGKDVFGSEIPATPGEPLAIIAGPGIRISANGREFSADIEGRLVHEEKKLSISPLLEIGRDIDYSIGNVDFVGKVIVRGSLLDGFYINAKRGVELTGEVGAGRITSEGDVVIKGGIKGKNAALISCRNLSAHYIDDAAVEAMGDVTATKEIMNSSVKSLGRVTVTTGAIIGGEVCGFCGVEADTLGSDMGVATRVMAGLNWTDENRKDDIRHQVAEYMERVQSAKMVLEPLFADKELSARLAPDNKMMLADIVTELREVREQLTELLEERAGIDSREQIGMVNQINVRKMLYMGVTVRFNIVDAQVKDSIKGPVSLMQDAARKVMETKGLAALPPKIEPSETPAEENPGFGAKRAKEA